MTTVTLVLHLLLALILIGIVLLQRSEGGGLGIGGGGGVMSGRQAATALGKVTWIFAVAFLATSMALTILTAREQASDSVIERIGSDEAVADDGQAGDGGAESTPLDVDDLLPEQDALLPPKTE